VAPGNDPRNNGLKDVAGVLGGFWYIANLQLFHYLGLTPREKPEHREDARKAALILAGQAQVSELAHLGLTPEVVDILNRWVFETTEAFLNGYFESIEKQGIENAILSRWDRLTARRLVDYFLFERAAHEFQYEFYAREWGWEAIPGGRILQILDSGRLTQTGMPALAADQKNVRTSFGGALTQVNEIPPQKFFSPIDAGLPVDGLLFPFLHMRHVDDWGIGNFYTAKLAGDFLHAMNYHVAQDLPYTYSSAGNSPYSVLSRLLLDPVYLSVPEAARTLERAGISVTRWQTFLDTHQAEISRLKNSPVILHDAIRVLNEKAMGVIWEEFQKHTESVLWRQYQDFLRDDREMAEDDALFLLLTKEHGSSWRRWPAGLHDYRNAAALNRERERLKPALMFQDFIQFILAMQKNDRDAYYRKLGISSMVDMAIAPPEAEVWKNPAAMGMSYENGLVRSVVQGVPGKKEALVGQLWNFSVYQWLNPAARELFLKIFETNLERADYLRLDQTLAIYRIFGFLAKGLSLKALGIFGEIDALRRAALTQGTREAKQKAVYRVNALIQKSVLGKARELGWPEDAIQFLFDASGKIRSNGNLLLIARKTPRELHEVKIPPGMPWQRWHWEEDDFLQGEPKWDVLRLTPNQRAQDDGHTGTWLFPEDGSEPPKPDDEIRAGYYMPSPGEAMMLELARIAQEKGKVLILETLGAVTPEIQRSSARFGVNYFPEVYAMGDPGSWYYPPNFRSRNGMVTFNVADTGSLQAAWQGIKNWDVKGGLVRSFFPNLPGDRFHLHMMDVTNEVHQKLLQMVYAPWEIFPRLQPSQTPLIAVLGLIDMANLPEEYRPNIPGQEGQWIRKLPPGLSLENLSAAARGEPSSALAALAVKSVRPLQIQRNSAYPSVNPADVKILRVKPDVAEDGVQIRRLDEKLPLRTHPFMVGAAIQGNPQSVELVVRTREGMEARFDMQKVHAERGEISGVSLWTAQLRPTLAAAYEYRVEIQKPDGLREVSQTGHLIVVPENADLNPVSPNYVLTPDAHDFASRSSGPSLDEPGTPRRRDDARSEVRAKKVIITGPLDQEDVLKKLSVLRQEMEEKVSLGPPYSENVKRNIEEAEKALNKADLQLSARMHEVIGQLKIAADEIHLLRDSTIEAFHASIMALVKALKTAYPEAPGPLSRPGRKPKNRSEVRKESAKGSALSDKKKSISISAERDIQLNTAVTLFGGILLPEDIVLFADRPIPPALQPYLIAPSDVVSVVGQQAIGRVLGQIVALMQAHGLPPGFEAQAQNGREKQTYIVGPGLLRSYGPLLFAVQKASARGARLIVVTDGSEGSLKPLEPAVTALNRQLPKGNKLLLKTPDQTRALVKAETLKGLGIGKTDAQLLRQLIPDFQPLSNFELQQWSNQVPGLTALIEKFQSLTQLAVSA